MYNKEVWKKYVAFKEANPCFSCGEQDRKKLEFHHYNPSNKFMEVSQMVRQNFDWSDIMDEINKCITVCQCCHTRIHRTNPALHQ